MAEKLSQAVLVPTIQGSSCVCLWGGFCCFSTLRDLLILVSLMISFVYLNSKPFRNPGLCHANKEDQGKLLLLLGQLGHSELPASILQQDPLENWEARVRETTNLNPLGWPPGGPCIPLIMEVSCV